MSIERFFVEDVLIYNPTRTSDRYGADVWNYDVEPIEAKAWPPAATSSEDHGQARDAAITKQTLWLPPNITVTAWSQVDFRGDRYKVIGRPRLAMRPTGPHHIVVNLELVEG